MPLPEREKTPGLEVLKAEYQKLKEEFDEKKTTLTEAIKKLEERGEKPPADLEFGFNKVVTKTTAAYDYALGRNRHIIKELAKAIGKLNKLLEKKKEEEKEEKGTPPPAESVTEKKVESSSERGGEEKIEARVKAREKEKFSYFIVELLPHHDLKKNKELKKEDLEAILGEKMKEAEDKGDKEGKEFYQTLVDDLENSHKKIIETIQSFRNFQEIIETDQKDSGKSYEEDKKGRYVVVIGVIDYETEKKTGRLLTKGPYSGMNIKVAVDFSKKDLDPLRLPVQIIKVNLGEIINREYNKKIINQIKSLEKKRPQAENKEEKEKIENQIKKEESKLRAEYFEATLADDFFVNMTSPPTEARQPAPTPKEKKKEVPVALEEGEKLLEKELPQLLELVKTISDTEEQKRKIADALHQVRLSQGYQIADFEKIADSEEKRQAYEKWDWEQAEKILDKYLKEKEKKSTEEEEAAQREAERIKAETEVQKKESEDLRNKAEKLLRDLDKAKQDYIEQQHIYSRASRGESKLKSIYSKFASLFKKKEEGEPAINIEKEETKKELDKTKDVYLEVKKACARAMVEQKTAELKFQKKSPEETGQGLDKFLQEEIFSKLIVGEERVLQEAEAADFPPKEKGIIRKMLDRWTKLPPWTRALISTLVATGVVGGVGGFALAGGVGAAIFAGTRFVRTLGLTTVLSPLVGRGVDWLLSKDIQKKMDKEIEGLKEQLKIGEEKEGEKEIQPVASLSLPDLSKIGEKYHQIMEKKAKRERRKFFLQVGAMVATGMGAAMGLGMLEQSISAPEAPSFKPAASFEQTQAKVQSILEQAKIRNQDILETARLKNENVIDLLRQTLKAQAEQIHVQELAMVGKGEGVWHAVYRQLEDRLHQHPDQFGLKSEDLQDAAKVKAVLNHKTGELLTQQKFIRPDGSEIRIAKPGVKVFLDPDNKIRIEGEGKLTYEYHKPKLVWEEEWGAKKVVGAEYWRHHLEDLKIKYPEDYGAGGLRVPEQGASWDQVQKAYEDWYNYRVEQNLPVPEELRSAGAAGESAAVGITDYKPLEEPIEYKPLEPIEKVERPFSAEKPAGPAAVETKSGVTEKAETLHAQLDETEELAKNYLNTKSPLNNRLLALKEMLSTEGKLKYQEVSYWQKGSEVWYKVPGAPEGPVDSKSIEPLTEFHQLASRPSATTDEARAVLEKLREIGKK